MSEPVYKNRYVILAIVLTGIFMSVLDGIVVSIALPTITQYFNVPVALSQWTITAYLVTMTSLLLIFGKVSEFTGKKSLFMTGLAVFTASSLACGLAPGMNELIAFRITQAMGAAMMFGISGAIIYQVFPISERGKSMGMIGATVAIGSIAGPVLGGLLVDSLGWEYIFLINVPIGLVLLGAAFVGLKFDDFKSGKLEMDWIGAVTLIIAMVSLMMLLGDLAESQSITPALITLSLTLVAASVTFIYRESRYHKPLLDLSIFSVKKFTLPTISMIMYFVANFMLSIVGPFYFQGVMGLSPTQVGLLYLLNPAIMVVASPLMGMVYDKHHFKYYAAIGMIISAIALALMGYLCTNMDWTLMIIAFVLTGIGGAIYQSPNNTEIMNALPKQKAGIASSVTATARNLGMALGVAVASILVSIQLSMAGYSGSILEADGVVLSGTISNVIYIAAFLCILGAIAAAMRNA